MSFAVQCYCPNCGRDFDREGFERLNLDFAALAVRLMETRLTLDREREKRRRAEKHIAKREKEIRFMLREAAGDQGTIDRLKRELNEPCQRCEMRREQESRR